MYSLDGRMNHEAASSVYRVLAASIESVRVAQFDLAKTYTNIFVAAGPVKSGSEFMRSLLSPSGRYLSHLRRPKLMASLANGGCVGVLVSRIASSRQLAAY